MNKQDAIKILEHPQVSGNANAIRLIGSDFSHIHKGMLLGDKVELRQGGGSWTCLEFFWFSECSDYYRIKPEVENVTYQITTTRDAKITIDGKHTIEEVK